MPGLADLVLGEDEFNLEDDGLAKELAELQARRAQLTGKAVEEQPSDAPAPAPKAKPPARPPPAPRRSLADTILATAGEAEVAVDKELEAMERELQKHLEELRVQQRGDAKTSSSSSYKPATAPVAAPEPAQESAVGPGGPEAGAGEPESAPAELHELRDLAAKMDEAFPEPDAADGGEVSEAPLQATLTKIRSFEKPERSSAPIDEEVAGMKDCLENLDVRLRVLQSKQEALIPASEPQAESKNSSSKLIEEMRAQNRHLRERLQGERLKSRLDLDTGLFGVESQSPAPATQVVDEPPKEQAD